MDFKERNNKRIKQLTELGLKFNFAELAYILQHEDYALYAHEQDITCYDEAEWDTMIKNFKELKAKYA